MSQSVSRESTSVTPMPPQLSFPFLPSGFTWGVDPSSVHHQGNMIHEHRGTDAAHSPLADVSRSYYYAMELRRTGINTALLLVVANNHNIIRGFSHPVIFGA